MGIWDKVKKALGPGEQKPGVITTDDFDQAWLANEIATQIADVFQSQEKSGEWAPFVGAVAIRDQSQELLLSLEKCVVNGKAPLLFAAGLILRNMGLEADFAEIVDQRGPTTVKGGRGHVLKTHVAVTPEQLTPPEDRAVFFPLNPTTGMNAPLRRLGDPGSLTIAEQFISADPRAVAFRSAAGL